MKLVNVSSVKAAVVNMFKASAPAKEAVAVTNTIKDGEKLMAAGQDAIASQAKAGINSTYVKPEIKEIKVERKRLVAASGLEDESDEVGRARRFYDDRFDEWNTDWE